MKQQNFFDSKIAAYRRRKRAFWSVAVLAIMAAGELILHLAGLVAAIIGIGALFVLYATFVGEHPYDRYH